MSATTYDFGDVRFVEKLAGKAEEPTADVEELNTIADHLAAWLQQKGTHLHTLRLARRLLATPRLGKAQVLKLAMVDTAYLVADACTHPK